MIEKNVELRNTEITEIVEVVKVDAEKFRYSTTESANKNTAQPEVKEGDPR
jgi:hypothetical protein